MHIYFDTGRVVANRAFHVISPFRQIFLSNVYSNNSISKSKKIKYYYITVVYVIGGPGRLPREDTPVYLIKNKPGERP
jgi:hypothetical protein